MKMNNAAESLNRSYTSNGTVPTGTKKSHSKTGIIVGSLIAIVVASGLLGFVDCFYCRCRGKSKYNPASWLPLPLFGGNSDIMASRGGSTGSHKSATRSYVSTAPSSLGCFLTFVERQEATKNIDEKLLLGTGGFGKVILYWGWLEGQEKPSYNEEKPLYDDRLLLPVSKVVVVANARKRRIELTRSKYAELNLQEASTPSPRKLD